MLKNLINILPARMNIKYGTSLFVFEIVVVTTQYPFDEICGHDEDLMAALKERFLFATVQKASTRDDPQKRLIVY